MEINEEKLKFDDDAIFLTRHYKQDYFTSSRHYHKEYEIAYIEQSEGKLYVGNNIVDFKAGELFVFAPRLVHCFKNARSNKDKELKSKATIVLFKKDFLGVSFLECKEAMLLNQFLAKAEAGIRISNPSEEAISLLKKLSFKKGLRSILDLLTILDILSNHDDHELLSARWVKKYYYKLNDGLLKNIFSFVEQNYSKEVVFKNAVELSGMSAASFSRYFKNRTEKTFSQYLNDVRVNNAKKMLINSALNINEICFACGYNNLSYFNRIFKENNGTSPKEFRNTYFNVCP